MSYFDSGTWDKTETDLSQLFRGVGQVVIHANPLFAALNIFPQSKFLCPRGTRGTAGQEGLTLTDTTIKCPTKVSHFWDARNSWDGSKTGGNRGR